MSVKQSIEERGGDVDVREEGGVGVRESIEERGSGVKAIEEGGLGVCMWESTGERGGSVEA